MSKLAACVTAASSYSSHHTLSPAAPISLIEPRLHTTQGVRISVRTLCRLVWKVRFAIAT
ncbi:hypothetical protein L226DRAFT_540989 [Lentinus tigrinus ALCF2SS1-7]|uniref:uncharacterized protein n=1 Tax=Lentinus tigrinus ALCF2SS1-7 TaxID=1328758 RepID=UPI001165DE6F|nr:hypothetical protein L226DRAFT_540989 [Lentinus tigrinus ALCF2SS1-7]